MTRSGIVTDNDSSADCVRKPVNARLHAMATVGLRSSGTKLNAEAEERPAIISYSRNTHIEQEPVARNNTFQAKLKNIDYIECIQDVNDVVGR